MKELKSLALKVESDRLFILDQQELPGCTNWCECRGPEEMVSMIQALKVRGAPLIGVAAALSLALYSAKTENQDRIRSAAGRTSAV